MGAAPTHKVISEPFDGTSLPITHIPNWTNTANQNKMLTFSDIPSNELIPIPAYDINALQNENNTLLRYTYTVPYMGSYLLNYKENDGSHLGIDIRAPIGTPVLSVANGVVFRAITDRTGHKFVVIRHDNVPLNNKTTTLYSAYLHLSEINAVEWQKIRKWEMLGRVGVTGITTAPHLHFQIDTGDAPFHPYWPFSGREAQEQNMNIFQAISAWLGSEKALKYTINPLAYVQHYLSGKQSNTFVEPKNVDIPMKSLEEIVKYENNFENINDTTFDSAPTRSLEEIVQFQNTEITPTILQNNCSVQNNAFWYFQKNVEFLQNKNCTFDHFENISAEQKVTRGQALIAIMKAFWENPMPGTSHFLDIPLTDTLLQSYAVSAYARGLINSQYLYPNRYITKAEFVEIINRLWKLKNAPQNYNGIKNLSKNFEMETSLQNYAYTIGETNMTFTPNLITEQKDVAEILARILKK